MNKELKHPHEIIGLLLSDYDPGRCDKITINDNWASDEGYDEDCEEYHLITGIVKTEHEYVLYGRIVEPGDAVPDIHEWDDTGYPFALIREKQMDKLLESHGCNGLEMRTAYLLDKEYHFKNPPIVGFRPAGKVRHYVLDEPDVLILDQDY